MAANSSIGLNIELPIYNADGTAFNNLVLHKSTYDSIVMSLSDKITGDVYYPNNQLAVTMQEYVELDGVKFVLVSPPTVVREGMASDNSQLNGMTKYSFVFYHPMYMLNNFPFKDVAVTSDQTKYLSESKKFSWIGYPDDFIAKLNKNLVGTEWIVEKSDRFPAYLDDQLSGVLPFDENTIGDALKVGYDTWGAPYVVGKVASTETAYASGKRFKVIFGLPSNEIYEDASHQQLNEPFVFQFGQGVGLKNNSRTPRNNKIITRIAGYGSENNIPYGYPQIPWYGDSRWDWTEYEGDTINYDADGKVTNTPKTTAYPLYMGILGGAYVKLIKHPFTRTNLMPSIYSQTLFNKVSPYNSDGTANTNYNPNTTLIDYYDAIATQEYPYPNPIVASAPSYESHQFEDIKPELGTDIAIVDAWPINDADLQPALSWDDSIDDNGNYKQGYFKVTLPVLTFDLYACAAITQEMQVNMRSGACLGCTFTVQVDWDDYKANFYDEDGNFAPTGSQRDYTKYPDTTQGQVDIILKKETATFGTLMPNMYQHPVTGDTFVVLGISLPTSYISNAESRLDGEMKSYMLENNVHYFDYPLKFDEAFLRNNTYILSQIKPNSVIRFKYGNDTLQLFVKQLTVKYGEKVLPQYDITLTDNVEVVLNQIGRVADDVEKLSALIAAVRQNYSRSVWAELENKLSKTKDDTAQGFIRFMKGLQVGNQFVSGLLGEGGVFRKEADGTTYLEADKMYIRMKAYFDTVEIREYQHTAGNRISSVAGNKCVRVAWFNSSNVELEQTQANLSSVAYFRCYFRASDGEDTVRNNFVIGDQVYCHITSVAGASDNPNEKGLNQKHYWRLCIGRNVEGTLTDDGEAWIDVSNRSSETLTIGGTQYTHAGYQTGSDVPEPQDSMVQLGNINDVTRQGAIIEFVTGADAPSYQIYQGINAFDLTNKNQISIGYNSATGHAKMDVFGDAYIGDRNRSTYIEYKQNGTNNQPELNIKAKINAQSTIGNQSMPDYIKANQNNYDDTAVVAAIGGLESTTESLQRQIDGAIDTWYYDYMPVAESQGAPANRIPLTNVEPYKTWYEADNGGTASEVRTERERHLDDIFYDNSTGYAFRFSLNETTQAFEWVVITDSAVLEALERASKAQATADGKMTIYSVYGAWVKNNVNTLQVGDLYIPTSNYPASGTPTYYAKKVYKCTTDGSATFEEIAYTDDSAFNGYINALLNGSGSSGDAATAAAVQRAIIGALGGTTVIDGGLMLTSLLALRKLNDGGDPTDVDDYTTWAGISGVYDSQLTTGGIAAWYGGDMLDKETLTATQIADGWNGDTYHLRWAKSLLRFDGSGYLANGNITWNKDGSIAIKDITTLYDSNNTDVLNELVKFNNAFHFNTTQGTTTVLSIVPQASFTKLDITRGADALSGTSVLNRDEMDARYVRSDFFSKIFQPYKVVNNQQVSVSVNEAGVISGTTLIDNLKILVGTWTDSYLSALGLNPNTPASSSTLADLLDVVISSPTDGQALVYDATLTKWKNANVGVNLNEPLSSINSAALGSPSTANVAIVWNGTAWTYGTTMSSVSWNDITNKPTTLAGYGITDAASSSDLTNYLPLSGGTISGGINPNADSTINLGTATAKYHYIYAHRIIRLQSISKGDTYNSYILELPNKSGTIAVTSDIPSLSGYATESWVSTQLGSYLPLSGGTLSGAKLGNSPILRINNTNTNVSSTYYWSQSALMPNMVTDAHYINVIGKAESSYNAAWFGYCHNGDGSNSNYATIGLYGLNDIIVATGAGNVGINTTTPSYKLHVNGDAYANSFIKKNGTSNQFLKADGSVDSSSYVTSSGVTSVATGTGLTGGTITSTGTISIDSTYQTYISHGESAYNSLSNYLSLSGGTISTSKSSDSPLLRINNTISSTTTDYFYWSISSLLPNMGKADHVMLIGKAESLKNLAVLGYHHSGTSGSDNNFAHIGLYGADYILSIHGNKRVGIDMGTDSLSYKLQVNGTFGATDCYVGGVSITKTTDYSTPALAINYSSSYSVTDASIAQIKFGNTTMDNYFGIAPASKTALGKNSYFFHTGSSYGYVWGTSNWTTLMYLDCSTASLVCTGGITALSDERHKTIVEDTRLQVDDIARMRAVRYLWNDGREDNGMHVGSIAQDWQQILPEVVHRDNDAEGTLSLQYGVAALVSSITIAKKVVNHEERIKELEKENQRLRTELEQLSLRVA